MASFPLSLSRVANWRSSFHPVSKGVEPYRLTSVPPLSVSVLLLGKIGLENTPDDHFIPLDKRTFSRRTKNLDGLVKTPF
jgi:hypothetical protein